MKLKPEKPYFLFFGGVLMYV